MFGDRRAYKNTIDLDSGVPKEMGTGSIDHYVTSVVDDVTTGYTYSYIPNSTRARESVRVRELAVLKSCAELVKMHDMIDYSATADFMSVER